MAQQDILDLAHEKLTAAWVDGDPRYHGADPKAIPIIPIITVIVEILLPLLKNCNQPAESIAADSAQPTREEMLLIRQQTREQMREEYGLFGYATHGGKKVVETIVKAWKAAKAEDIAALTQRAHAMPARRP